MVRALLRGLTQRLSPADRRPGRPTFRPAVEALETRLVPTVSFTGQQTFALSSGLTDPFAVAVADFNGDGRPDLVVANLLGNTVSVLLNATSAGAGTPTFTAQQTYAAGRGPTAVAVGDFNGDGRPDIVVANFGSNTVSVLMNTTPAGASTVTFAAAQTFAVGSNPNSVAVGDFNGDGRPDLAVANFGSNTVSVLVNTTPAGAAVNALSFSAQETFATGNAPSAVAAVDLNGDGRPDLAVVNNNNDGTGSMSVLLNTTAPAGTTTLSFAAQQTFALGASPQTIAVGDFNGDGRPDLAVAGVFNDSGYVLVLVNTTAAGAATASFTPPQQAFVAGTSNLGIVPVAAADFNGDGLPDLVVGNTLSKSVSVLVNTTTLGAANVAFAAQQTFAVGSEPLGVAVGDFSGDGAADIATVNDNDNTVSVLLNTTPAFSTTTATTTPVVVAQFGSTGVWEYNRASKTWNQLTVSNASLLAADPQGDVVAEFHGYGVQLYRPAVGWRQINGVDATALAMDANGDVAAQFPGYGVGEYLFAAGWRSLTAGNASLLAMDANGDVVGEFPGYGVQLYRPAVGWQRINGVDASLLAMAPNGDVVADFPGYGVGEYLPASGWQTLNGTQASALAIDAHGDVVAAFPGYGVGEYLPATGWSTFVPANAALLAIDANGEVYADFAGFGLWELDPYRNGMPLRASDASVLAVA